MFITSGLILTILLTIIYISAAEDNQCVVHRLSDDDIMQGKRHPDLRMCDLSEQDISKTDLIGVVMEKTSAVNTSFVKARLCKGILKGKLVSFPLYLHCFLLLPPRLIQDCCWGHFCLSE